MNYIKSIYGALLHLFESQPHLFRVTRIPKSNTVTLIATTTPDLSSVASCMMNGLLL